MAQVGFGSYRFNAAQAGQLQQFSTGVYANAGDTHAFLQVNYRTGIVDAWGGLGLVATGITLVKNTLYGTANTTKASDGTLKAASPVARIVNSQDENQRKDVAEDGFIWCGCGTSNAEAEGITISRLDTGVYVLTGSAGLASEGWQLLPPMDPGGMGEMGIVEAEQTESGGLTIRLFRRKYMLTENGEMVKAKGEPIDVPANSWIDVRLDMPESSVWNTRIAASKVERGEPEDAQS
ncbi:phage tail fiber protein [Escherichia coli]